MRKCERGRRTPGAALALAAAGGAIVLVLGGCGQSGPLYLPEKASLAAGAAGPAAGVSVEPSATAGEAEEIGAPAFRNART